MFTIQKRVEFLGLFYKKSVNCILNSFVIGKHKPVVTDEITAVVILGHVAPMEYTQLYRKFLEPT